MYKIGDRVIYQGADKSAYKRVGTLKSIEEKNGKPQLTVEFDDGETFTAPVDDWAREFSNACKNACTSTNSVARNAIAANRSVARNAAFDNGSVLVSYKGFGSPTETLERMTSRDFKTWLEKNGLGDSAQEIWFALMKGDDYAFMAGGTKVKVKAL